jgi:cytidylate kinase
MDSEDMPRGVVAISHTPGAGGEDVGRLVAERLGLRYVDEEIVLTAAAKEGLDPSLVADAERRKSLRARLLAGLSLAAVDVGVAGSTFPPPEPDRSDDFRTLILEAIADTADEGDVVIVAHAASMALAGRKDLLRVFITASPETRAGRIGGSDQNESIEASKAVKRDDAARADYVKRFHMVDRELPTHYDLVINTDALGLEEAAEIVVRAATI